MKRLIMVATLGLFSLGLGAIAAPLVVQSTDFGPKAATALWVSKASTIDELTREADAVVRGRVEHVDTTRKVEIPLPPELQKSNMRVDVMPFTDARLKVLAVYKGSVGPEITVMQTGGQLASTANHPRVGIVMADDPLFVAGVEHILFLTDISADRVHSVGRKLYRVVNPAGRYDVAEGNTVRSHARVAQTPPATLTMLESLVREAAKN